MSNLYVSTCTGCGTEVMNANQRKLYCTEACKQRVYRQRKKTRVFTLADIEKALERVNASSKASDAFFDALMGES